MSQSDPDQELRIEKSCPLTSAHTRLRQAHELWHRTAESYPLPDEFVLNLNQLIMTLRQVTFMLQTQKDKIEDFDEWYEVGWREKMKEDPLMAWLHDARTKVEKVGDLEIASTALVSVIANWVDGPYAVFEVPPHVGPEEILSNFETTDLPDRIRKEGILTVERRWVANDLPGHELTDVCAHGYGVVATILSEAHERLGVQMQTFGGETHEGRHSRTAQLGGRLPCMLMTREKRTAHLHLASGRVAELGQREVKFDPRDAQSYEERARAMLMDPRAAFDFKPDEDPLDMAGRLSSVACRTLAHDGYHQPIAFFFDSQNAIIGITGLEFEDQAEKYMIFRAVADEAERLGATTVVQVGEMWEAEVPKERLSPDMKRPSEMANRTETLSVMAGTADGRERTYQTPFTRDAKGMPVLGETRSSDGGNRFFNASFIPLMTMWARRRAARASR
jgi:hypothetical protein